MAGQFVCNVRTCGIIVFVLSYCVSLAATSEGKHALMHLVPMTHTGSEDMSAFVQTSLHRDHPKLLRSSANTGEPSTDVQHTRQFTTWGGRDATSYFVFVGFVLLVVINWALGRNAVTEKDEATEDAEETPQRERLVCGVELRQIQVAGWIIVWMATSAVFVVYNKWLFTRGGFPHPLMLSTFHMAGCFFVFGSFRSFAPRKWKSQIMPDADVKIPWKAYVSAVLPVALLYGVTLGAGNVAFLYSSVAFLQMIKPLNVVFTSVAAFAFMLETPTITHMAIVCVVAGGVSLAASSDVEFSTVGLLLQLAASMCEGLRLALLQKLMTKEIKLDPLTTIIQFAPMAGLALSVAVIFLEEPVKWHDLHSPGMFALNIILAIVLNIFIVQVIRKASAVVFTMCGVIKDIAAIAFSVVLFHTPVNWLEVLGYVIAIIGIAMYKFYKDNFKAFQTYSCFAGLKPIPKDKLCCK